MIAFQTVSGVPTVLSDIISCLIVMMLFLN
jgi:hypothetical protein